MSDVKISKELTELVYALELYKSSHTSLTQQLELVKATIADNTRLKETLEYYKKMKKNEEFLVQIGGDTYLFVNRGEKNRVIIDVGSNTCIESDIENSIKRIDRKIEKLDNANENLSMAMNSAEEEIRKISEKINVLYQKEKIGDETRKPCP